MHVTRTSTSNVLFLFFFNKGDALEMRKSDKLRVLVVPYLTNYCFKFSL